MTVAAAYQVESDNCSLELPDHEELRAIVEVASSICATPISAASIISGDRVAILSSVGITQGEVPLDESFCKHTIEGGSLLIVADTKLDNRFKDLPAVAAEEAIRFYAGLPLRSSSNTLIGTLCVADGIARELSDTQKKALLSLGRHIELCMELRLKNKRFEELAIESLAASKKLRTSHDLLASFLNNGPFLTYIKDSAGRYVFYNDRLADRFGVKGDEWIGRSDGELWPAEMATQIREHDLDVLRNNAALEIVEDSVDDDGNSTPWRSHKFPFVTEDGDLMVAGVSIDISEEVKREATLTRLLEERTQRFLDYEATHFVLTLFMENSPHHAYLKDENGRYLYYNKSFAEHHQIKGEEWIGRTDFDIFAPSRAASIRTDDLTLLLHGDIPESVEYHRSPSGKMQAFRSLKFTYRNAEGQPIVAGLRIGRDRPAQA